MIGFIAGYLVSVYGDSETIWGSRLHLIKIFCFLMTGKNLLRVVFDGTLKSLMAFDNFLMVTSALVSSSSTNLLGHLPENFLRFSLGSDAHILKVIEEKRCINFLFSISPLTLSLLNPTIVVLWKIYSRSSKGSMK